MHWLNHVSALVLRVRGLLGIARPTPPAGPVSPEPTTPLGSSPSALDIHPQPPPAPTQPPLSSDPALSTSTEQKLGSEKPTVLVEPPLKVVGSKSPKPARQRRQPAKQASKPAKKAASKTKAAAKPSRAKAPARTRTANPSGGSGN